MGINPEEVWNFYSSGRTGGQKPGFLLIRRVTAQKRPKTPFLWLRRVLFV
jgi:hypothetical protein